MAVSWKTLRVFISSTFKDMQAERDHLVRFVFPKLREELLKHRIHLIDVDLRWGVTSDQDAVSICREVIDECHPRFMGMLGGRYGWIPDGHEHSITADEVRYGVLESNAETWGNALFYFRDEAATASIVEDTPGDFREPEGSENARKLAELKQSIVNAGLPAFAYEARWDTLQKRLTGLEAFGDHVYAYLLKNIQDDPELDDHFASSTASPIDEFAEEREAMEAFIEDRTERYVVGSRQALLDQMTVFAAASSEQNILVIEGEPGSGKSSLLGKFCQSQAAQGPSSLIFHFVGASVGSTNLRHTLRRLCHELAVAAGANDPLPEDIRELIDLFGKLLTQVASRERVVLVIDAINQFDATDGAHDMTWLPLQLPPTIRIIASSLEHPALQALRRRGEPVRIEKLALLSGADTFEIIDAFLQRYSKRLSPEQIAALMAKPESRLPLYVLTALQELRTLGTYEEITARIRELPGEAKALFAWILKQRLSNDPGFRNAEGRLCGSMLVGKFVSCLGVSRHGLSQEELIGLLDPGDTLGNVAALLRLLRPYLMHRGELIDFFHNQLREAVEDGYLKNIDLRLQAHQSLAVYFHDVADPNREGRWRGTSTHALTELPYHQVRAQTWPELVGTLENIFFLEARVTKGTAFDLALDFSDAVSHLPSNEPQHLILRLLEEAFRRDIHFVVRHPSTLFQCLWNSCWWYDTPEASKHYEKEDVHRNHSGDKLYVLLEKWCHEKEVAQPNFIWLRSVRPPPVHLGTAQKLVLSGHEKSVDCVSFSPDGRLIVSGSSDKTVRIWKVHTGAELVILRGHEEFVGGVAFAPNQRELVSGGGDKTLRIWNLESGTELAVLRGHERQVNSIDYSPDGRKIISGSKDTTVRTWDARTGAELSILRGHDGEVFTVRFSSDGQRIISGSADGTLRIWDAETGEELIAIRHGSWVKSAGFSPDGRHVLSGSIDNTVRLWSVETGVELLVLRGHTDFVHTVSFSPDGQRILSGAADRTVRVWDARSGVLMSILQGHGDQVLSACYSSDGRSIVSSSGDMTIRLWDAQYVGQVAKLRGHEESIKSVSFSPNGRQIASGSDDNTIRLWDAQSGLELAILRGHEAFVDKVRYSPDGRRIASGSYDKSLRIWDTETGAELAVLRGHKGWVRCFDYSPDGRKIVSGSNDKTVRIWDAQSGAELLLLNGHTNEVWTVSFSPDGRRIASGSQDQTVRVYDAQNGLELAVLGGSGGWVWSVTFSPDARTLVAGSRDGTCRIWNMQTFAEIAVLSSHGGPVHKVTYSLDGQRIVSWSNNKIFRIWDAHSFDCLQLLKGFGDITDIATGISRHFLLSREMETVLELTSTGTVIASLPMVLNKITSHPLGQCWAGWNPPSNYLALFRVESPLPTSGANEYSKRLTEEVPPLAHSDVIVNETSVTKATGEHESHAILENPSSDQMKPTDECLKARGFRPTSSWYWERKMDDILGFDIICPKCGAEDAYYPKDDLQPEKCANCCDHLAAVTATTDKQPLAMSILTCCHCEQSFTFSEPSGCSYHPKAPVSKDHCAGPEMDFAEIFVFPCCGEQVCKKGVDTPPPMFPGCVNGDHKAITLDGVATEATAQEKQQPEALPAEQIDDQADDLDFLFNQRRPFRPHHFRFAQEQVPGFLWRNFDQCGHIFFEFPPDATGHDDSMSFLRDFAMESWQQVFDPSEGNYLSPEGLDVARRDLANGYRAAVIILPPPEVVCEAYMIAIVYRPTDGEQAFVLRYFMLERGLLPQSSSDATTFLCELGQDTSHLNLLEGPSPDIDSFCEALSRFLVR